jgi:hypothetical protein
MDEPVSAAPLDPAATPMSIASRRASRSALDGDGAYARDELGTWFDTLTGAEVPGASDLVLRDLYDPPIDELDGALVRIVPRTWASRHPEHPLAWIFAYADLGGREPVAVPAAAWEERADEPVAMAAPELHPHHLIGVDGVAAHLGVTPATVRSYLARAQMPAPVTRIGGSPVWPRPLIERWIATRRVSGRAAPAGERQLDETAPPTGAMPRSE